jgi:hypothetical protein
MTAYNKFRPSYDGSTFPTMNAAASGDQVISALGGVLVVKTGGTGTTVTIDTPGTLPNGDAYPQKAIVIGTSAERWIPLGPEYIDANGMANLSWSSTATVTWACVALPM